jgi:hypothetical protein
MKYQRKKVYEKKVETKKVEIFIDYDMKPKKPITLVKLKFLEKDLKK